MDALGVAIRFALYLDLMVAFGIATFGVLSLRGAERVTVLPLRPMVVGAGVVGVILSVLGLLAMAAAMAAVPLSAVDRETVTMLVTGTAAGTAWVVRMVALALVVLVSALWWKLPRLALYAAAVAGGVALATLAWTGHGAMDEGAIGWLHLLADITHLIAAGVWIGALLGLSMLVMRRAKRLDAAHLLLSHRALEGFSTIGTMVVAVIVISGLVNSWLLVGPAGIRLLGASLYGPTARRRADGVPRDGGAGIGQPIPADPRARGGDRTCRPRTRRRRAASQSWRGDGVRNNCAWHRRLAGNAGTDRVGSRQFVIANRPDLGP